MVCGLLGRCPFNYYSMTVKLPPVADWRFERLSSSGPTPPPKSKSWVEGWSLLVHLAILARLPRLWFGIVAIMSSKLRKYSRSPKKGIDKTVWLLTNRLRELRDERNLTQEKAAALVKMSYKNYQRIELGERDVWLSTLGKLAKGFAVEFWELLAETRQNETAKLIVGRVKLLREQIGLTPEDMAKRIRMSPDAYQQLESGERDVQVSEWEQLAETFQGDFWKFFISEDAFEERLLEMVGRHDQGHLFRRKRRKRA